MAQTRRWPKIPAVKVLATNKYPLAGGVHGTLWLRTLTSWPYHVVRHARSGAERTLAPVDAVNFFDFTVGRDGTLWGYGDSAPLLWVSDSGRNGSMARPDCDGDPEQDVSSVATMVQGRGSTMLFGGSDGCQFDFGTATPSGISITGTLSAQAFPVLGGDGNTWLVNDRGATRLSAGGGSRTFSSGLPPGRVKDPPVRGNDGAIYFTKGDYLVRVARSGAIKSRMLPQPPRSLTAGADGTLWFLLVNEHHNPAARTVGRLVWGGKLAIFEPPGVLGIFLPSADGTVWYWQNPDQAGRAPAIVWRMNRLRHG